MKSKKFGFFLVFAVVLAYLLYQHLNGDKKIKNTPDHVSHIVAFGDNLTLGNLAEPSQSYPQILEELAGITVENKGVANETTELALARLQNEGHGLKGELVIITLGVWDLMTRKPLSETLSNLGKIFEFFLNQGYMVVYGGFTVPPTGDNWLMAISQLCGEYGVLYVGDLTPEEWVYKPNVEFTYAPLNAQANQRLAKTFFEKISGYL